MAFIADKVALVTGGAAGIGLAIVKSILKNGARGVALVDFNREAGTSESSKLKNEFGDKVMFVHADVAKSKDFEDAFIDTVKKFNNLDIVVNNAAIFDETDWERTVQVNLIGTLIGTRLALDKYLPKYKSSEKGVIVNVGSIGGLDIAPAAAGYCSSKHGIVGLGRNLATSTISRESNVNVLTICPGTIETPMLLKFFERLGVDPVDVKNTIYPPEYVGKNVIDLINSGKRGVYVLEEGGPPYKLKFPFRKELKLEE